MVERRLRRAAERFGDRLADHGMTIEGVGRRPDGRPEIRIRIGEEGRRMGKTGKSRGPEQMSFEGLGVSGVTFALRSVADLGGKEELRIGEQVGGEWSGSVVGVTFEKNRDGVLIRRHIVSVNRATIGVY